MTDVSEGLAQAYFEACRDGNALEVTRMLNDLYVAGLIDWGDPDKFCVRIVLMEDEGECGSHVNVTRRREVMVVDVSLTRPCVFGSMMILQMTPLLYASWNGHVEVVRSLLNMVRMSRICL